MRAKLRWTLPLAQTALAVVLLWQSERWLATHRGWGMGPVPQYEFLVTINAPAALVRVLLLRHLSGWWDDVVLVSLVAVLWYWVAENLSCWLQRRTVLSFSSKVLRIAWDSLVIVFGLSLGFVAVANEIHFARYGFHDWRPAVYGILMPGNWLAWSLAFVLPFGRDLVRTAGFRDPE